jgi:hypothetical protein
MKKRFKKALSLLVAISMLMSMPITAFAAPAEDDLVSITIKGITVSGATQDAILEATEVAAATGLRLSLTASLAEDDIATVMTLLDNALDPVAAAPNTIRVVENAAAVVGTTDAALRLLGEALTSDTELEDGNIILVETVAGSWIKIAVRIIGDWDRDGDSTVADFVLNVTIPMALDYALDPTEIRSALDGNQISAVDFFLINESDVAVLATVNVTAIPGANVKLVDDVDDLDQDLPDGRVIPKDIKFGLLGAVAVADLVTIAFGDSPDVDDESFDYDPTEEGTLSLFDVDDAEARIRFVLRPATGTPSLDTLAADDGGVASFTLYAQMNTYADWADGDLDIEGVYDIRPVRLRDINMGTPAGFDDDGVPDTGHTDYPSANNFPDPANAAHWTTPPTAIPAVPGAMVGLNVLPFASSDDGDTVGFGTLPSGTALFTPVLSSDGRTLTVTVVNGTGTPNTSLVIPFDTGGKTVTVTQNFDGSALPATRGTWNQSSGELTVMAERMNWARNHATAGTQWVVDLTVDVDSTPYKVIIRRP